MLARERYNQLVTDRRQFLDKAVDCSELTLPYLIQDDTTSNLYTKLYIFLGNQLGPSVW